MTPAERDAIGRVIYRETAHVERCLHRRRLPPADVEDIAQTAALIVYRSIAKGSLVLPANTAEHGRLIAAFMRTAAWHTLANRKHSGDIFYRHARVSDEDDDRAEIVVGSYTVDVELDLASELAAEPPKARRLLLAMLDNGEACLAAACVAAGMTMDAGRWSFKRTRERAAARLAAA